ncbi:RidA family protein [Miniphocaeibacter massiliensis]|uniref:RidA family protein n=1 Tax=Miniphocaeibacter massiliensis TaxID=2041841 RepID=UPI000C1C82B5|nr:RidA family protein [Miniphocaeibacter massiliensis]
MNVYENLKKLGYSLPKAPAKGGLYAPIKEFGNNLAYVSGCGPQCVNKDVLTGKIGGELTEIQGKEAAERCILNVLSVIDDKIGDLNKIKSFVKLLVFVSSEDNFFNQPQVADTASKLLKDIFGEEIGISSRSAIGVNVLPGNIPVEIEALIELI